MLKLSESIKKNDNGSCLRVTGKGIQILDMVPSSKRNYKELFMSNNDVSDLTNIKQFHNLVVLRIEYNFISEIKDLEPLSKLNNLKNVSLAGNPVSELPLYKMHMMLICPHLSKLDGKDVNTLYHGKYTYNDYENYTQNESLLLKDIYITDMVEKFLQNDKIRKNNSDSLSKALDSYIQQYIYTDKTNEIRIKGKGKIPKLYFKYLKETIMNQHYAIIQEANKILEDNMEDFNKKKKNNNFFNITNDNLINYFNTLSILENDIDSFNETSPLLTNMALMLIGYSINDFDSSFFIEYHYTHLNNINMDPISVTDNKPGRSKSNNFDNVIDVEYRNENNNKKALKTEIERTNITNQNVIKPFNQNQFSKISESNKLLDDNQNISEDDIISSSDQEIEEIHKSDVNQEINISYGNNNNNQGDEDILRSENQNENNNSNSENEDIILSTDDHSYNNELSNNISNFSPNNVQTEILDQQSKNSILTTPRPFHSFVKNEDDQMNSTEEDLLQSNENSPQGYEVQDINNSPKMNKDNAICISQSKDSILNSDFINDNSSFKNNENDITCSFDGNQLEISQSFGKAQNSNSDDILHSDGSNEYPINSNLKENELCDNSQNEEDLLFSDETDNDNPSLIEDKENFCDSNQTHNEMLFPKENNSYLNMNKEDVFHPNADHTNSIRNKTAEDMIQTMSHDEIPTNNPHEENKSCSNETDQNYFDLDATEETLFNSTSQEEIINSSPIIIRNNKNTKHINSSQDTETISNIQIEETKQESKKKFPFEIVSCAQYTIVNNPQIIYVTVKDENEHHSNINSDEIFHITRDKEHDHKDVPKVRNIEKQKQSKVILPNQQRNENPNNSALKHDSNNSIKNNQDKEKHNLLKYPQILSPPINKQKISLQFDYSALQSNENIDNSFQLTSHQNNDEKINETATEDVLLDNSIVSYAKREISYFSYWKYIYQFRLRRREQITHKVEQRYEYLQKQQYIHLIRQKFNLNKKIEELNDRILSSKELYHQLKTEYNLKLSNLK